MRRKRAHTHTYFKMRYHQVISHTLQVPDQAHDSTVLLVKPRWQPPPKRKQNCPKIHDECHLQQLHTNLLQDHEHEHTCKTMMSIKESNSAFVNQSSLAHHINKKTSLGHQISFPINLIQGKNHQPIQQTINPTKPSTCSNKQSTQQPSTKNHTFFSFSKFWIFDDFLLCFCFRCLGLPAISSEPSVCNKARRPIHVPLGTKVWGDGHHWSSSWLGCLGVLMMIRETGYTQLVV